MQTPQRSSVASSSGLLQILHVTASMADSELRRGTGVRLAGWRTGVGVAEGSWVRSELISVVSGGEVEVVIVSDEMEMGAGT